MAEERRPARTEALGHRFRNPALLDTALTHRSFVLARAGENNEKLEFLGDAVLDLAMSDLLMQRFPDRREGDLSKLRASLVNAEVLADKAARLGLGRRLKLGRGEEKSGGRAKGSILASAYEAVLGAVYLDAGFGAAKELVARHFAAEIEERATPGLRDYKTRLQEITQRRFRETPVYTLVQESGPDHEKRFVSQITIAGRPYGQGEGRSKKTAEQAAAKYALARLAEEGEGGA